MRVGGGSPAPIGQTAVMPQSHSELVKTAYEALDRRDLDGFLRYMDPDVEFTSLIAEERVLVKLTIGGEVSGVQVEQLIWQAIQVRGERAVWWKSFRTEEEALEGLEERGAS